ncbi:hypothetical protein [Herbidospora mongoliensis]|uniref:hypothetical protein n=1 Tax=Herbidospora mongoliensis TaxID=688067 RepID=UPI0012FC567F|nr:hypothetical protein [Herbidospora mongoliensis]
MNNDTVEHARRVCAAQVRAVGSNVDPWRSLRGKLVAAGPKLRPEGRSGRPRYFDIRLFDSAQVSEGRRYQIALRQTAAVWKWST